MCVIAARDAKCCKNGADQPAKKCAEIYVCLKYLPQASCGPVYSVTPGSESSESSWWLEVSLYKQSERPCKRDPRSPGRWQTLRMARGEGTGRASQKDTYGAPRPRQSSSFLRATVAPSGTAAQTLTGNRISNRTAVLMLAESTLSMSPSVKLKS